MFPTESSTEPTAVTGEDSGQPYPYRRTELYEPDWTRFPGWAEVTETEWRSVQWQRAHCVKSLRQLRGLWGDLVDDRFYADLERDQQRARHHVDAGAPADAQHDGQRVLATRRGAGRRRERR